MHPHGVAAEVCPPADAVASEVGVVGLRVLRVVDVLPVAVEPVFRRTARLAYVAEDAGVAHIVVSKCEPEEIESAPALHRLARGLLSIARAVADSAGERMARPRIERAKEREALVAAVPVRVVLRDELQHAAEAGLEVFVDKAEERTGPREVAIVEMVVVESVGVVARVLADESAPAGDVGEVELVLARSPREPVLELGAESFARLRERRRVADLARGHHRARHLEKPLPAPVRVAAEIAARRVVSEQTAKEIGAVRRGRGVPLARRGPAWQQAGKVVDY